MSAAGFTALAAMTPGQDSEEMVEGDALEAVENLARKLVATEAERTAALGCVETLQRLLLNEAIGGGSGSSEPRPLRPRHRAALGELRVGAAASHERACRTPSVLSALPHHEKENTPPSIAPAPIAAKDMPKAMSSCMPTPSYDDSRWSVRDAELGLQGELAALSRQAGVLRARCVRRRGRAEELDSELAQGARLLMEQTALTSALRARVAALREVPRQPCGGALPRVAMSEEGPIAVLQARSDLHRRSCELACLDNSLREVEARTAREAEAEQAEEARCRAEAAAVAEEVEATRSEFRDLSESLSREEARAHRLIRLECEHALRFEELHSHTAINDHPATIQVRAWRAEVQAQREAAVVQGEATSRVLEDCRKAEDAKHAARTAEAVALDAAARAVERLRANAALARRATLSLREQTLAERRLCSRLTDRLRLMEQSACRLRRDGCRWVGQRHALEEVEARIAALADELAPAGSSEARFEAAEAIEMAGTTVAKAVGSSGSAGVADTAEVVPLDVSHAEAARILASAASRLGVVVQSAGGSRGGGDSAAGGSDAGADIMSVAMATCAAARALREELATLLPCVAAALPRPTATLGPRWAAPPHTSTLASAGAGTTVRGLLRTLSETFDSAACTRATPSDTSCYLSCGVGMGAIRDAAGITASMPPAAPAAAQANEKPELLASMVAAPAPHLVPTFRPLETSVEVATGSSPHAAPVSSAPRSTSSAVLDESQLVTSPGSEGCGDSVLSAAVAEDMDRQCPKGLVPSSNLTACGVAAELVPLPTRLAAVPATPAPAAAVNTPMGGLLPQGAFAGVRTSSMGSSMDAAAIPSSKHQAPLTLSGAAAALHRPTRSASCGALLQVPQLGMPSGGATSSGRSGPVRAVLRPQLRAPAAAAPPETPPRPLSRCTFDGKGDAGGSDGDRAAMAAVAVATATALLDKFALVDSPGVTGYPESLASSPPAIADPSLVVGSVRPLPSTTGACQAKHARPSTPPRKPCIAAEAAVPGSPGDCVRRARLGLAALRQTLAQGVSTPALAL